LKIPKRYSEAVNRRTDNTMTKEKGQKERQHNGLNKKDKRRDNTMVKRKRTKGETTQWTK
jgi:hypothetical protein